MWASNHYLDSDANPPERINMTDCPRHKHCAYTGTEPGLCPTCHSTEAKCAGTHGQTPASAGGGRWLRGYAAGVTHPTLRSGASLHPAEAGQDGLIVRSRPAL
jgi:hypothetical protein